MEAWRDVVFRTEGLKLLAKPYLVIFTSIERAQHVSKVCRAVLIVAESFRIVNSSFIAIGHNTRMVGAEVIPYAGRIKFSWVITLGRSTHCVYNI